MYKIAICDDNSVFAQDLETICKKILNKLHIECPIQIFSNGKDLLDTYTKQNEKYHILLLDILMDGINGMDLAHKIRAFDKDVVIIFVSVTKEYMPQAFDVNASNYLEKPVDEAKLTHLIKKAYEKIKNKSLLIKSGTKNVSIPFDDMMYLETQGGKVILHLVDRTDCHHGYLKYVLPKLPKDRFVQCHQSYVINMDYIFNWNKKDVTLKNKTLIPIGRDYKAEAEDAFFRKFEG